MTSEPHFRPITLDDVRELAALVAEAFLAYRAFAPAGWKPPSAGSQVEGLSRWVDDLDSWGELAEDADSIIGHATLIPASRHSFRPTLELEVAHLGHLFLKPAYWGSGVATKLLRDATSAA